MTNQNGVLIRSLLQKELHFEDKVVLEQMKNAGMLQMIHMNKSGYGAKYTFTVGAPRRGRGLHGSARQETFVYRMFFFFSLKHILS